MEISELQAEAHQTAVDHGWWDGEINIAEKLALIHSEISEALEEYRDGKMEIYYHKENPETQVAKPEGFAIEMADTIIRIVDLMGALNLDLEEALTLKLAYNKTRSYRHGGRKI